jgi:hypothetical protein
MNISNYPETDIINKVNSQLLMDYTTNVAKQVRLSGSPEELCSFRYIEEKMKSFGLKTDLTFSNAYISLPLDSKLTVNGVEYGCITASMSAPTGEQGIHAEMLFVGSLSALDDLKEEAKGKIVIFHGFAGRAHVQKAEAAGAVGCIFINGERLHNMIVSPVWGNPTPETFPLIPKISILSINKYDGKEIIEKAEKGSAAHIITRNDDGWRKIPNLIAEVKGAVEPEKFILLSGHVDSWEYGAMDNASANAVMMEVGRILAQSSLRRSLRIAFWSGHSHGRYAGSANYFDTHFRDIHDNCLLHVNIDSVGAIGADIVTEGNIMPLTKALAVQVIQKQTNQQFKGKPFGRSGDQSFWGAGVPSAFMAFSGQPIDSHSDSVDTQYMINQFNNGPESSGFGWWWHSNEDTMDKIDEMNLKRDASVFLEYIYRSCNDPLVPLDLEAGLRDFTEQLNRYKEKAKGHISLASIERSLSLLHTLVAEINTMRRGDLNESLITKLNSSSHIISRVIVRLMQVGVSKFEPDLALPMPAIPLLSDINLLEEIQREKHQYLMLLTKIQRHINQVDFILREGVKEARISLERRIQ